MPLEHTAGGDLLATTQADLPAFRIVRPDTLAAAREALAGAEAPVALYAGGTDFFARVRRGEKPATLVSLSRLADLKQVSRTDGALTLGACVTHVAAAAHPALDAVPGLAAAWRRIATVRIRQQATLGGNLMARNTRYELSILLTALSATALMDGPDGPAEVPVQDLWDGVPGRRPLLVSVSIPLAGRPRLDYDRDLRPLCTLAAVRRDGAAGASLRVAMGTEWLRPWWTDAALPADPAQVMAALPPGFADPAAGNAWLRRAGAAMLARRIARLEEMA